MMTAEQKIKNLSVPEGKIDAVLDSDTYNEADDQFALAYMLASKEKINTKAIYAAPFSNARADTPKEGMEKSYEEIKKILSMLNEEKPVFKGSDKYLPDENTPVLSDAAHDLAKRAAEYSPQNPLYVVTIGAITNIASALLISPEIAENIVVVWLGGHARHFHDTYEFNMFQDIAAARVVMKSGAAFVQLPCCGVVSSFTVSAVELEYWFKGKNAISDYLYKGTVEYMTSCGAKGKIWSKCIWDVTAVAWLLNDNNRFMLSRLEKTYLPTYDYKYGIDNSGDVMRYVYYIHREALLEDLIKKITGETIV